jgi:filamentous hemagglutinin
VRFTIISAHAVGVVVENNYLSADKGLAFDKELSGCRKSGGDCQSIIAKWWQVSDKQSAETDQKLKDNSLEAQVIDKEITQGGSDMSERPGWTKFVVFVSDPENQTMLASG